MKAKKEVQEIQGTKQELLKVFREMCYSRSAWQVWADLISMIACSLANSTDPDKAGVRYLEREREYKQCAERLGGVDKPAQCMAVIVEALERNPEQDFLGELFMELELGNHWKGQFFTPYCVCKAMSNIVTGDVDEQIEQRGYISVCDPACGAGATLIATVSEMKLSKYNFQNHVVFVGQDVDRVAGMMCYIQLSLLGCAGYICIGDTLTNPVTGHVLFPQEREGQELWIMPMFRIGPWAHRRLFFLLGKAGWNEYREAERGREREAKKRMEQTKRALEEILGENKDVQNAFQVKGKGLLLVVPASAEDIKAEGAALHHCVGTYVDRVARGETNIFFIRKEQEPDKPYFTMEWKDNDIVQCRGSRNCGMPPEVKAFTEAFKKKMLETIEKDKGKGLRRCG